MGDIDGRGVLYPARLPVFHREASPPELAERVRWFWIPEWDLAPGRASRQELLAFPACNLVVESDGTVTLSGATTRMSFRDLEGRGWAVGALLRPAAAAALHTDPRRIRDGALSYDAPDLCDAVRAAMGSGDRDARRRAAVEAYGAWIGRHLPPADADGRLANAMEDLVASDRTIVRVDQLAEGLGLSVRSVQRLARRYVGVTPLSMIRRYRLQEAAQRLREDPEATIGRIAGELGYADQAHLCADFRTVIGFNPSTYRRHAGPDADAGQ